MMQNRGAALRILGAVLLWQLYALDINAVAKSLVAFAGIYLLIIALGMANGDIDASAA